MTVKIEKITSVSNTKIKFIRGLLLRKNRLKSGLFIAEGERVCKEAITSGWIPKYLVFSDDRETYKDTNIIIKQCVDNKGYAISVPLKILSKISKKDNPQTIIGVFENRFSPIDKIKEDKFLAWVALDRVRDPGNLGTIIRTCDATGANGVILIDDCCDPFSPESVRASMGAIFSVNIVQMTSVKFLAWVKNRKEKLVGTSLNAKTFYTDLDWGKKPILLMGNEQSGLTKDLQSKTDINVKMPMMGSSDSLNLSVATGIFLYEILRKS